MDVELVQVVTAMLALLAAVLAVAGAGLLVAGDRMTIGAGWDAALRQSALWLAAAVAATAMFGSLYFSEIADYSPCKLCWYQRIAMYGLAVILAVAALRGDRRIAWYAVPLAAAGAVTSTYHYLVEWNPSLETSCDPFNPCSLVWFRRFGFVTLPFMALCGFLAVIALTLLAARETERR